jgi:glycosyltransferase involved in cell wall biosynthesis
MHVLHLETGMHLYGGALQVYYLLEGMKQANCRNTLVCPQGSEIALRVGGSAKVHQLPMAGEVDPRFLFGVWSIIRSERPDIVHLHSRRGADTWGLLAARTAKRRVVLTRRVDNPEFSPIARLKYGLCDRVVTISEGIREVLLSEGVPSERLSVISSAVDSSLYDRPCDRTWFCKEFGFDSGDRVVGTIAQLIPRKGHRYLIEAAPAILKTFPHTRFLFLGRGPLKEEIKGLCRAQGVQDRFQFAGFRDDLPRLLSCLDVVVHPATLEGLGVSLLQAAAAGVPIIGTRVGGIPEIVCHGVNGYLVDPGDSEGIALWVLKLLENPEECKRLGQAGQEIVHSRFSIERMVAGYLRIYAGLCSRGKGAAFLQSGLPG